MDRVPSVNPLLLTQLLGLLSQLVHQRHTLQDIYEHSVDPATPINNINDDPSILPMSQERRHASRSGCYKVDRDQPQEQDEVLVIAVPETVVYVHTVVVEFLDTLPADHAVEGPGRLDDFAVEAEVLKVNVAIIAELKELKHVQARAHIPRVHTAAHQMSTHHTTAMVTPMGLIPTVMDPMDPTQVIN